jgi:acid phosphatase
MPNLWKLRSSGSVANAYYAPTHPSIGNYNDLAWGIITTNDDNCTPTSCGFPYTGSNLVRSLNDASRSWKGYAEDLPSPCFFGGNSNNYLVRHSPIPYISDVQSSCNDRYVAFQDSSLGFAHDRSAGTLPNFAFITPNACDDAHNCSLNTADTWVQNHVVGPLTSGGHLDPTNGDTVLIVTFDESANDNTNGGGHVYWFVMGKGIKQNYQSNFHFYSHPSTLRLLCTLNGIAGSACPGAAANAPDMGEFLQ